jgi:hypothetical protein
VASIFDVEIGMSRVICLDVEFSSPEFPELLSVGMAGTCAREHYMEIDPLTVEGVMVMSRCSDFAYHGGVLEQWGVMPGCAADYATMARRTANWLSSEVSEMQARVSKPVLMAFDYEFDFTLLEDLLRRYGYEEILSSLIQPLNVSELTFRFDAAMAGEEAFETLSKRGLRRHHALADALSLRASLHAVVCGKRMPL